MTEEETPAGPQPTITPEALSRWASLPIDTPLQIHLRRADLDCLFLAIRESIIAQSDMGATILALSNGRVEDAQKNFTFAKEHLDQAIKNIDTLIVHAMTTAEPVK